jgi:hypothetical protein
MQAAGKLTKATDLALPETIDLAVLKGHDFSRAKNAAEESPGFSP